VEQTTGHIDITSEGIQELSDNASSEWRAQTSAHFRAANLFEAKH
jgi:hypothetical protein